MQWSGNVSWGAWWPDLLGPIVPATPAPVAGRLSPRQSLRANGPMPLSPLDNFAPLDAHQHMLAWLGENPPQVLRDQFEAMLGQQVAGTTVPWIRIVSEPRFLTVGPCDSIHGRVRRTAAATALAFSLMARGPDGEERDLHGVATMLGADLDAPPAERRYRFFLELNGDLGSLGSDELLTGRLREFVQPPGEDSPITRHDPWH